MSENLTVIQQIERIGEEICDHYCKWPENPKYSIVRGNESIDELMDKLHEEHCNDCPLQKLC